MLYKVEYEYVEAMRQYLIDHNYSEDGLTYACDFQNADALVEIENIVGENIEACMFSTHTGEYDNIFVSFWRPSFSHSIWFHYIPDEIFSENCIPEYNFDHHSTRKYNDGDIVRFRNTIVEIIGYSHTNIYTGIHYQVRYDDGVIGSIPQWAIT